VPPNQLFGDRNRHILNILSCREIVSACTTIKFPQKPTLNPFVKPLTRNSVSSGEYPWRNELKTNGFTGEEIAVGNGWELSGRELSYSAGCWGHWQKGFFITPEAPVNSLTGRERTLFVKVEVSDWACWGQRKADWK